MDDKSKGKKKLTKGVDKTNAVLALKKSKPALPPTFIQLNVASWESSQFDVF